MYTSTVIIGIGFVVLMLWICYAAWAAPLMRENQDGSWTTLRPEKKFSDLFKRKPKSGGSYSDLEKLKRGRSKY